MSILNHAGMSYISTGRHLKHLAQEVNHLRRVQSGTWLWVYDVICNMMDCSPLTDHHSSMLNVSVHLTVDIRYLPTELDFTNTPQKSRNTLTVDDILLSSEDGEVLVKCAIICHSIRSQQDSYHDVA